MDKNLVLSLAEFASDKKNASLSEFEIFNLWASNNGVIVENIADIKWMTSFIKNFRKVDGRLVFASFDTRQSIVTR